MEALIGRSFGPYQIVAPLGAGAMGKVYKAVQGGPLNRFVALKVLPHQLALDPEFNARFIAVGPGI